MEKHKMRLPNYYTIGFAIYLALSLGGVGLACNSAIADERAGERGEDDVDAFFRELDRNGDGKIQRNEMEDEDSENFDEADINSDGVVTKRELARAFDEERDEDEDVEENSEEGLTAVFERLDADEDGKIQKRELLAFLVQADTNEDGAIEAAELEGWLYGRDTDPFATDEIEFDSVLKLTPLKSSAPRGFDKLFTKQVDVFGINIFATDDTPSRKVVHAANVMAQYLDNDGDGQPDNARVHAALKQKNAALVMFPTERTAQRRIEELFQHVGDDLIDRMSLQDLYGAETHPDGASRGTFDGALEEVLHLITHAGYASAYPGVFGEKPGTRLGDAMDKARGGRFTRMPRRYPKEAWYTYYDQTCDYGCQATEYIYWGLTSLLGGQDFEGRGTDIGDEWRLNTPEKFKRGDKLLFELLTDEQYRLPTRLPDGRYRPK